MENGEHCTPRWRELVARAYYELWILNWGVPTPHVVEYGRNTYTDSRGQIVTRVQSPSSKETPRPANAEEIP